jgi:hypothetical protein
MSRVWENESRADIEGGRILEAIRGKIYRCSKTKKRYKILKLAGVKELSVVMLNPAFGNAARAFPPRRLFQWISA